MNLKKPKLHPGNNNFVEVGVAVQEGFKIGASVSIRHPPAERAPFLSVVKNIVGCTYAEEREAQRDHVVRQWWDQLKLDMPASDPGRAAAAEHGLIEVYRYGLELSDAVFGLKSPNTLLKRLCAIKLYGQWVIRNYAEAWIPLQETRVWNYVRLLRETKASASRAVSLLESIRFCFYVLKVDGSQDVLDSLRIKGLAAQLYSCKQPWRPSDVLSVNDVEFLHFCFDDTERSDVDRIFIGHLLHMLYARARFSDLLSVTELFLDEEEAFLEVQATLHKGARGMDTKSKLLPIVAPAVGIKGGNWAKSYLSLRKRVGLANPKEIAMPMLLSPKRSEGGWSERYITSQELNKFIKRLFADGGRQIAGRKLTSHSMKATGLSWCAKMGIPQEHRAVLARHAISVQGATVLYSRDLMTTALRSFNGVLESIRTQLFHPDKTRSGMITPAVATPAGVPATPFPARDGLSMVGHQKDGLDMVEKVMLAADEARARVDAALSEAGAHKPASPEPYSPGTPVQSPGVKQEFEWPSVDWNDTVIGLDLQHDLLVEWYSGSEEESSGCSDSSEDEYDWDEAGVPPVRPEASSPLHAQWFINVKTNVIHESRNAETFRCGRAKGPTYVAVPALTGLRCGKCFPDSH